VVLSIKVSISFVFVGLMYSCAIAASLVDTELNIMQQRVNTSRATSIALSYHTIKISITPEKQYRVTASCTEHKMKAQL